MDAWETCKGGVQADGQKGDTTKAQRFRVSQNVLVVGSAMSFLTGSSTIREYLGPIKGNVLSTGESHQAEAGTMGGKKELCPKKRKCRLVIPGARSAARERVLEHLSKHGREMKRRETVIGAYKVQGGDVLRRELEGPFRVWEPCFGWNAS